MAEQKNIFISHIHEDDALLPRLKELISRAGVEVRDSSINSTCPNNATNADYIKSQILAPQINWASTLVVLITHETAQSDWVNWEIKYAVEQGKKVVGVFAQGATDADMPDELKRCGDAAVVGWNGDHVVGAILDDKKEWDDPATGLPRGPEWELTRYSC